MRPLILIFGIVVAGPCAAADQAITLIDDACVQASVDKCLAEKPRAPSYQPRANPNVREIDGVCKPGYARTEIRTQTGPAQGCVLHDPDVADLFRSSFCRELVLNTSAADCRHKVSFPGAK